MTAAGEVVVQVRFGKGAPDKSGASDYAPATWTVREGDTAVEEMGYRVSLSALSAASDKVRAAVDALVRAADPSLKGAKFEQKHRPLFRGVAEAGAELYNALFTGSDAEQTAEGKRVRAWYEAKLATGKPFDVEFRTVKGSERPLCPWTFLYPPAELAEADESVDAMHSRFWGFQHRVTAYEVSELKVGDEEKTGPVQWKDFSF
jgi:hypothetical protein